MNKLRNSYPRPEYKAKVKKVAAKVTARSGKAGAAAKQQARNIIANRKGESTSAQRMEGYETRRKTAKSLGGGRTGTLLRQVEAKKQRAKYGKQPGKADT